MILKRQLQIWEGGQPTSHTIIHIITSFLSAQPGKNHHFNFTGVSLNALLFRFSSRLLGNRMQSFLTACAIPCRTRAILVCLVYIHFFGLKCQGFSYVREFEDRCPRLSVNPHAPASSNVSQNHFWRIIKDDYWLEYPKIPRMPRNGTRDMRAFDICPALHQIAN